MCVIGHLLVILLIFACSREMVQVAALGFRSGRLESLALVVSVFMVIRILLRELVHDCTPCYKHHASKQVGAALYVTNVVECCSLVAAGSRCRHHPHHLLNRHARAGVSALDADSQRASCVLFHCRGDDWHLHDWRWHS